MMIYLAHPYGGDARNKDDAAKIAAGIHAETGLDVFNPLDEFTFLSSDTDERGILYACKGALETCSLIVFCPGWEQSRGCRYERMIAKKRGIPRMYINEDHAALFRELSAVRGNAA